MIVIENMSKDFDTIYWLLLLPLYCLILALWMGLEFFIGFFRPFTGTVPAHPFRSARMMWPLFVIYSWLDFRYNWTWVNMPLWAIILFLALCFAGLLIRAWAVFHLGRIYWHDHLHRTPYHILPAGRIAGRFGLPSSCGFIFFSKIIEFEKTFFPESSLIIKSNEKEAGMEHLELVLKAINGDGEAFYQLILPKQEDFYRIAYSYVKNKEDALDIIHETVYKAFKSLKSLKKPEFFYTWLTRILINTSIDYAKNNWKVFYLFTNALMYSSDFMNRGLNKDEKIDLYSAIDTLKENYKTVIILKYFNGLTLNEIAELLDVPLGTVKTNLHKALAALRNEMKEEIRFAPAYRSV